MPSFNRVMLIGNLTRDPQVKVLPSQTIVCEFGLAMNRKYRTQAGEDKEEVCFVDCTAFAKQAETIAQWCKKGKPLFVEGRLKFDTWEDRTGGAKRSKLTVVVENFQFLGGRDDAGGGGGAAGFAEANGGGQDRSQSSSPPARTRNAAPSQRPKAPQEQAERPFSDDDVEFTEAEIPFAWEGRTGSPV